jgi:cell division protein FtsW
MIPVLILLGVASHYYDKEEHRSKELPAILNAGRIPTWISRIQTFIYSSKDADNDKSYQVNQAKIAIATGGFFGVGPGRSQGRNYLPQAYNDFIYPIILEEYGFAGGVFMVFIYLLFLFRCIRLYKKCPFAFGAFLALALSFMLVIQAIANMGVGVNLFPNTGVTLPLVSMGGSSFLFTCLSIGIILSVARNVEQSEGANIIPAPVNSSKEEKEEA